MENKEQYESLAQSIFFSGISSRDVLKFAKYRNRKNFQSLIEAVNEGRLDGIGCFEDEIECIATRLHDTIEINPEEYKKYACR